MLTAKYGLKAVVHLASIDPQKTTQAIDIAEAQNIRKKFLDAILGDLRTAGIVEVKKGPGGGYRLARVASEIKAGAVIVHAARQLSNLTPDPYRSRSPAAKEHPRHRRPGRRSDGDGLGVQWPAAGNPNRASEAEEIEKVAAFIRAAMAEGLEPAAVGVFVRSRDELPRARAANVVDAGEGCAMGTMTNAHVFVVHLATRRRSGALLRPRIANPRREPRWRSTPAIKT